MSLVLAAGLATLVVAALFVDRGSTATADLEVRSSIAGGLLRLEGLTNLPEGTILQYAIIAGAGNGDLIGPHIDGTTTVRAGGVIAYVDVSRFPPGLTTIWMTFDPGPHQPPATIDRFGVDGARLRGPQVVDDEGQPRLIWDSRISIP
jgi:hypothetical protein